MIIIIMGVSGSGKSTIGKMLAESLHWEFTDADAFHSSENINKMSSGIPLDDSDRIPWLQDLQRAIAAWLQVNKNIVLACSALKASYRQFLVLDEERIKLVYLRGSLEVITQRLQNRQNHFMSEKLLQSQFDALQEPENAICVDVCEAPQVIVQHLREALGI
ncbi:MAG: gluconokinase [Nostocaceae cyanobacterium]|nr:gluconokinase [Nostocaceae cyanobacterium]